MRVMVLVKASEQSEAGEMPEGAIRSPGMAGKSVVSAKYSGQALRPVAVVASWTNRKSLRSIDNIPDR